MSYGVSSVFKTVSHWTRYGLGAVVDGVAQSAQSPSIQLALMSLLLANLPLPVLAVASAKAVSFLIKGKFADDDDPVRRTAAVGLSFSPDLPPGLDFVKAAESFAALCIRNATAGVDIVFEAMEGGVQVYTKSKEGITAVVTDNFSGNFLNRTCVREVVDLCLSGVTPTPPNPGAGADTPNVVSAWVTGMAVLAGALAAVHIGVNCRHYYLKENRHPLATTEATAPLLAAEEEKAIEDPASRTPTPMPALP